MYSNRNISFGLGVNNGGTRQGHVFDPRIGSGGLPPGIQGTADKAYTRSVQPNELSQNQLTGLLAQNGTYIQNARQQGLAQAQSRGLLNSSAASGSAQRSAIEGAAPFALQDAQAFGAAAGQNQDALNQMALQQANAAASLNAANAASAGQAEAARLQAASALQRQREQLAFSGEQNQLDRQQQWGMANFQFAGNNWMADQDLSRAMQSTAYGTALGLYGQGISNILNLPNQMFSSGLIGSDYFANPQELSNFFGGFYNAYTPLLQGVFGDLFSDLGFGGG